VTPESERTLVTLPDTARRLCRLGVLLVLLGLATGAFTPLFDNPRQGLAAHSAGVQNGILLTVLGLVWRHLRLGAHASRVAAVAGAVSLYAIWIGFVLAAGLGTGRATPMAAAGRHGEPWQETLVSSVLGAGSAALVVAILAVLWGLRAARASRE
jgi:hydroxylaminobenzene mutase